MNVTQVVVGTFSLAAVFVAGAVASGILSDEKHELEIQLTAECVEAITLERLTRGKFDPNNPPQEYELLKEYATACREMLPESTLDYLTDFSSVPGGGLTL